MNMEKTILYSPCTAPRTSAHSTSCRLPSPRAQGALDRVLPQLCLEVHVVMAMIGMASSRQRLRASPAGSAASSGMPWARHRSRGSQGLSPAAICRIIAVHESLIPDASPSGELNTSSSNYACKCRRSQLCQVGMAESVALDF